MKEDYSKLILWATFLALFCLLGPVCCTQKDKTVQLLEQQGYKEVKITGWRPFMAADSDSFSTGFEAKAPNGQKVTGAVTGGLMKGSTIRFD